MSFEAGFNLDILTFLYCGCIFKCLRKFQMGRCVAFRITQDLTCYVFFDRLSVVISSAGWARGTVAVIGTHWIITKIVKYHFFNCEIKIPRFFRNCGVYMILITVVCSVDKMVRFYYSMENIPVTLGTSESGSEIV